MNLIAIISVIVVIIVLLLTIFSASFRDWMDRQLRAVGALLRHFFPIVFNGIASLFGFVIRMVGVYIAIIFIAVFIAIVLMTIAVLIGSPGLTLTAFVFSLSIIVLAWLPAGLVVKLFRLKRKGEKVVPVWLKNWIATVAFIGFVAAIFPEVITFKVLMGTFLVGFIFAAGTSKINVVDKIIIPLTTLMIAILIWNDVNPEGFRSSVRYASSWTKVFNTTKDRGSLKNESQAATTYAITVKDISVLYNINEETMEMELVDIALEEGVTTRLVNHKNEVVIIDGQGFVQIQLRNEKGTFVQGKKFWVEADFVEICSPKIALTNDTALKVPRNLASERGAIRNLLQEFKDYDTLEEGKTVFFLDDDGETPWFAFKKDSFFNFGINSPDNDYVLKISDGREYKSSNTVSIELRDGCFYKVKVSSAQDLVIEINYR